MSKIRNISSNCRQIENMHAILIILVRARITSSLIKKAFYFFFQTNDTICIMFTIRSYLQTQFQRYLFTTL